MSDNDELGSVQEYRRLVLEYEASHAEVNALIHAHQGNTENMSQEALARYRALARQRDELLNEIRWLEMQLLDDEDSV